MFVFGLLWWRSGRPHRPGGIIGLYLIVSSVFRIAIEYYRFHDQALPFGLPFSLTQWISAGLIVLGLALLVMRRDAPADPNPR
jgi:prolipoprotein diacylglyceryltransferase